MEVGQHVEVRRRRRDPGAQLRQGDRTRKARAVFRWVLRAYPPRSDAVSRLTGAVDCRGHTCGTQQSRDKRFSLQAVKPAVQGSPSRNFCGSCLCSSVRLTPHVASCSCVHATDRGMSVRVSGKTACSRLIVRSRGARFSFSFRDESRATWARVSNMFVSDVGLYTYKALYWIRESNAARTPRLNFGGESIIWSSRDLARVSVHFWREGRKRLYMGRLH